MCVVFLWVSGCIPNFLRQMWHSLMLSSGIGGDSVIWCGMFVSGELSIVVSNEWVYFVVSAGMTDSVDMVGRAWDEESLCSGFVSISLDMIIRSREDFHFFSFCYSEVAYISRLEEERCYKG